MHKPMSKSYNYFGAIVYLAECSMQSVRFSWKIRPILLLINKHVTAELVNDKLIDAVKLSIWTRSQTCAFCLIMS